MAAAGPARPVVTVCGTEPSAFGGETPFILLARVQVKPGMVDAYLEAAAAADKGVMDSEPGMLHHTVSESSGAQAILWQLSQRNSVTLCGRPTQLHPGGCRSGTCRPTMTTPSCGPRSTPMCANFGKARECLCKLSLHPRPANELTRAAR